MDQGSDLGPVQKIVPGTFSGPWHLFRDAAFIAKALGDIARAKGMSEVARDAGLSRESLYKALSGQRNPDFSTILAVTRALGVQLHAAPAA